MTLSGIPPEEYENGADEPSWGQLLDRCVVLQAKLDKANEAGNSIAEEFHAVINEPMYAGTRKDWIWRAQAAEAKVEDLRQALSSIANNSCCGPCQEAKLVAKKALGVEDGC